MRVVEEKDKKVATSPDCALMGCSMPVRYVYCD